MKWFRCNCGYEAIGLEVWKDNKVTELWLSFWTNTIPIHKNLLSWKDRFKVIWKALKGELWHTDSILLDKKDAVRLANTILKEIK